MRYRLLEPLPRKLGNHPPHIGVTIQHVQSVPGDLVERLSQGSPSPGFTVVTAAPLPRLQPGGALLADAEMRVC